MNFLEEVEELVETHSVEEGDLLSGIGSLLTGSAKIWHKSMKNRIYTWNAFRKTIRQAFMPNDDDDTIIDRLKKMRQRAEESYVVYEARMQELFRRLENPLDEKKRLKLLLDGLHLFYRTKIRSADLITTRDLRRACNQLEPDKAHIRKF